MTGPVTAPRSKLYSPRLLALSAELARFPFDPDLPRIGEARSRTCGSTIRLGLASDPDGTITRIGMLVSACAVGQSSAALLALGIAGADPALIAATREAIAQWLDGNAPLPNWPGLDALAPAREHRGRHGALMLAWDAAIQALSSPAAAS
jgi:NifU-like protein involved in Fe-S cluster formation